VLHERGGDEERHSSGRIHVLFTELLLKDGTKAPVCGILFSNEDLDHVDREGIPVTQDPKWFDGVPFVPTTTYAHVRFYWPP